MNYFIIVAIAISLSMDAFSLALSVGTLKFRERVNLSLAGLVGAFHFIMPTFGTFLGGIFFSRIGVDAHFLEGVIFLYISTMMFKDFKKDEDAFNLSILGAFIFALGVSLDSFGVGFVLQLSGLEAIRSFVTFAVASAGFTYCGLRLGSVLNTLVGEYSILVGAIIMAILGIINFCQFLL